MTKCFIITTIIFLCHILQAQDFKQFLEDQEIKNKRGWSAFGYLEQTHIFNMYEKGFVVNIDHTIYYFDTNAVQQFKAVVKDPLLKNSIPRTLAYNNKYLYFLDKENNDKSYISQLDYKGGAKVVALNLTAQAVMGIFVSDSGLEILIENKPKKASHSYSLWHISETDMTISRRDIQLPYTTAESDLFAQRESYLRSKKRNRLSYYHDLFSINGPEYYSWWVNDPLFTYPLGGLRLLQSYATVKGDSTLLEPLKARSILLKSDGTFEDDISNNVEYISTADYRDVISNFIEDNEELLTICYEVDKSNSAEIILKLAVKDLSGREISKTYTGSEISAITANKFQAQYLTIPTEVSTTTTGTNVFEREAFRKLHTMYDNVNQLYSIYIFPNVYHFNRSLELVRIDHIEGLPFGPSDNMAEKLSQDNFMQGSITGRCHFGFLPIFDNTKDYKKCAWDKAYDIIYSRQGLDKLFVPLQCQEFQWLFEVDQTKGTVSYLKIYND